MTTRKRLLAGASAVALAAGTTLAGAGLASAQGSSEIADSLGLAATALNGPVTVSGNAEGGPTVSYTNETGEDETCAGFTMPYSSVDEVGLDPAAGSPTDLLPQIVEIENLGGVSMLSGTAAGAPIATDATVPSPVPIGNVAGAVLVLVSDDYRVGASVAAGETVTWEATAPDEPAAAAVLCIPDALTDDGLRITAMTTSFGIDPQVVADQINDRLGPLGSIQAGSVSGGSVETGANLLGSLGETEEDPAE